MTSIATMNDTSTIKAETTDATITTNGNDSKDVKVDASSSIENNQKQPAIKHNNGTAENDEQHRPFSVLSPVLQHTNSAEKQNNDIVLTDSRLQKQPVSTVDLSIVKQEVDQPEGNTETLKSENAEMPDTDESNGLSETTAQVAIEAVDGQDNEAEDAEACVEEEQPPELKDECENHVNFAIICSFFQQFGDQLGINSPIETIKCLLEDNSNKVPNDLIELHLKLLRKIKKYVNRDRWENGLIKFVSDFSQADAWEIERFGYRNLKLENKLVILRHLLEAQFDFNAKFKQEVNNSEALLLRLVPIGRDVHGNQYWYHLDNEHTLRIYREHPDEDRQWKLICQDKDEFAQLISEVENEKTLPYTPPSDTSDLLNEPSETDIKLEPEQDANDEEDELEQQNESRTGDQNDLVELEHEQDKSNTAVLPPKIPAAAQEASEIKDNGQVQSPTPIKLEKCGEDAADIKFSSSKEEEIKHEQKDEIRPSLMATSAVDMDSINCLLTEMVDKIDKQAIEEAQSTKGKRGRKRRGLLAELGIDDIPKNDVMPVKRSSRIQQLQEKRNAEMKLQLELEAQMQQKRLEEMAKKKALKAQKEAEEKDELEAFANNNDEDTEEEEEVIVKPKKRGRKKKNEQSSDSEFKAPETNKASSKKKKNQKAKQSSKKQRKQKNGKRGQKEKRKKINWSSNEEHDDDEDEVEEEDDDFDDHYEDDEELKFDDNDEFACEEFDSDEEPVVVKRARTAKNRKISEEDSNDGNDDTPCQKCTLYSNPDWILLCDNCNLGYHTHCLAPRLYLIPDGDWFCPRCENIQLLEKLRFEFDHYVQNLAKRQREQHRKERLKFDQVSADNILQENTRSSKRQQQKKSFYFDEDDESEMDDAETSDSFDDDDEEEATRPRPRPRKKATNIRRNRALKPSRKYREYSDESEISGFTSSDEEEEEKEEEDEHDENPQFKVRSARKRVSYQFKEYDALIESAICVSDYEEEYDDEVEAEDEEDDEDKGKSPYSKGKDIANLAKLDAGDLFGSDEAAAKIDVSAVVDTDEEAEKQKTKTQAAANKRKRKLNDLDSPEEAGDYDSDFSLHASSATELEDEETEEEDLSNDVDEEETDLSDWERKPKRPTRSSARKPKRRKNDDYYSSYDDESDYDDYHSSKRSRAKKKVTYTELSTTEEDDDISDWSDNSEKKGKSKKKGSASKKRRKEDSDFTDDDESSGSDISFSLPKKKRHYSDDENFIDDDDETDEDRPSKKKQRSNGGSSKTNVKSAKKSTRVAKKKVFDDFTDGEEAADSEFEAQAQDEDNQNDDETASEQKKTVVVKSSAKAATKSTNLKSKKSTASDAATASAESNEKPPVDEKLTADAKKLPEEIVAEDVVVPSIRVNLRRKQPTIVEGAGIPFEYTVGAGVTTNGKPKRTSKKSRSKQSVAEANTNGEAIATTPTIALQPASSTQETKLQHQIPSSIASSALSALAAFANQQIATTAASSQSSSSTVPSSLSIPQTSTVNTQAAQTKLSSSAYPPQTSASLPAQPPPVPYMSPLDAPKAQLKPAFEQQHASTLANMPPRPQLVQPQHHPSLQHHYGIPPHQLSVHHQPPAHSMPHLPQAQPGVLGHLPPHLHAQQLAAFHGLPPGYPHFYDPTYAFHFNAHHPQPPYPHQIPHHPYHHPHHSHAGFMPQPHPPHQHPPQQQPPSQPPVAPTQAAAAANHQQPTPSSYPS